jgi:hypothetical protein
LLFTDNVLIKLKPSDLQILAKKSAILQSFNS